MSQRQFPDPAFARRGTAALHLTQMAAGPRASPCQRVHRATLPKARSFREAISQDLVGDRTSITPLRLFVLLALHSAGRPSKRAIQDAARDLPGDFPFAAARRLQHRRRLHRVLRDLRRHGLVTTLQERGVTLHRPTPRVHVCLDRWLQTAKPRTR